MNPSGRRITDSWGTSYGRRFGRFMSAAFEGEEPDSVRQSVFPIHERKRADHGGETMSIRLDSFLGTDVLPKNWSKNEVRISGFEVLTRRRDRCGSPSTPKSRSPRRCGTLAPGINRRRSRTAGDA